MSGVEVRRVGNDPPVLVEIVATFPMIALGLFLLVATVTVIRLRWLFWLVLLFMIVVVVVVGTTVILLLITTIP